MILVKSIFNEILVGWLGSNLEWAGLSYSVLFVKEGVEFVDVLLRAVSVEN